MKLKSFYKIYYEHRLLKANFFLKIYLLIIIPIRFFFKETDRIKDLDLLSNNNSDLFKKSFDFLCEYFNTDKGIFLIDQYSKNKSLNKIKGHSYSLFYEKIFSSNKDNIKNILEIGSFKGNAVAACFFYFKNSLIHSADLYPDLFLYKSNRVKNYFLDSGSEASILSIKNNLPKLDIIIDDAGHYFKDQIITLFSLFEILNPKGYFIIEELDFPDTRKDMNILNETPTLKNILSSIKSNIDFNSKYITYEQKKYFLDNFESINIFKGTFNEIVFIKKK
jgi:hypothetical protein